MPHDGAAQENHDGGEAQRREILELKRGNRSVRCGGIGSEIAQNLVHKFSSLLSGSGKTGA
ncbi:hypothetical protein SDC9_156313 [bioreactor metagenome]|uniref:Uncharacterized protein n=1 Tax=bioreactor metagenome TaxID=1076179 RepID=A0A645F3W3_9ZZZZ